MKYLATILLAVSLSTTSASAQILFDPDFSSGLPSGYTVTNANVATPPDSITYSGGVATFGDYSVPGANDVNGNPTPNKNYISGAGAAPNSNTIDSTFTFTPTYNYTGNDGGQGNINIFSLYTEQAFTNNPLFSVTLQPFRYSGSANLVFASGVQYGTDGTIGGTATVYSSSGINSLSGLTLTVNAATTSTDLGPNTGPSFNASQGDRWLVETQGTLYEGTTLLYTFDVTATADTANGFNPITGTLMLSTGVVASTEDDNVNGSYFSPGATVGLSNIVVEAVPEPSTYALFGLGLAVMLVFVIKKKKSEALS